MTDIKKVLEQFHKGDLEGAASLAEKLLHKDSNDQECINLLNVLGSIHAMQGRFEKAKEDFQSVLDMDETNVDAHYNLAKVLTDMNNKNLALKHYERILKLKQDHVPSYNNIGAIYESLNNYEKAIEYFSEAIRLNPNYAVAINNLANIYFLKGDYTNSINQYRKSLLIEPNNPNTLTYSGIVLEKLGYLDEAKKCHENALSIDPKNGQAYNHLGLFFEKISQYEEAIKKYKEAIKLEPKNPDIYTNLGVSYRKLGDYEHAIENDKKALSIDPEHANAHNNLSMSLLKTGDIGTGWEHYEYRNSISKGFAGVTNKPRWNGEPIQTGLFIWPEQGIGDLIMFAKLFADLRGIVMFPQIIVCLDDRLVKIFERSFPDFIFVKQSTYKNDLDSKSLDFDYQIPIGSLAKLFLPSYDKLEELEKSYLLPDKEKTSSIKNEIKKCNKLIIGISWKTTNKEYCNERNVPLALLTEKLSNKKIQLINLQYGDVSEEISLLEKNLKTSILQVKNIDIFNDIDSFSSLIDACDLVVTIDNSTAHLAGSLGKETYLLLPKISDWRWMLDEDYTPWYKSLKLFRNSSSDNWTETLNKVNQKIIDTIWSNNIYPK